MLRFMGWQRVGHDRATELIPLASTSEGELFLPPLMSVRSFPLRLLYFSKTLLHKVFPGGLDSKASAYNVGYLGLIPGFGGSPGEGNGNPLQHS